MTGRRESYAFAGPVAVVVVPLILLAGGGLLVYKAPAIGRAAERLVLASIRIKPIRLDS